MIKPDSIFYHLPIQLDRKQAFFLDGIRHAAEISELAYRRLQKTLTWIANEENAPKSSVYAAAFLDAWALVDAIDRFRSLSKLLPNSKIDCLAQGQISFHKQSEIIRSLRNVADHLAQRADYVVAHKGVAMGSLSWFTTFNAELFQGKLFVIVPGTTQPGQYPAGMPAGKQIDIPTGYIHLSAGEYTATNGSVIDLGAGNEIRGLKRLTK